MITYRTPLYLPTGGLLYDPLVWVDKIRTDFVFVQSDPTFYHSHLEYMLLVIKNNVSANFDVLDMHIQDFYFLWTNFIVFNFNQSNDYTVTSDCGICGSASKVRINFGKLKFFQKHKWDKIVTKKTVKLKEYSVDLVYRTPRHCIDFGYLHLAENSKNTLHNAIYYFLPQIASITSNNFGEINKSDYIDFLTMSTRNDTLEMYEAAKSFNKNIGFQYDVQYTCPVCRHISEFQVFDDIGYSILGPTHFNVQKFNDMLKAYLELSRLPVFDLRTIMQFPLQYNDNLDLAIREIEFKSGAMMF